MKTPQQWDSESFRVGEHVELWGEWCAPSRVGEHVGLWGERCTPRGLYALSSTLLP